MYIIACNFCLRFKPLEAFSKNRLVKSGHDRWCKPCHALATAIRRAMAKAPKVVLITIPKRSRAHGVVIADDCFMLRCKKCLVLKKLDEFPVNSKRKEGRAQPCKICAANAQRDRTARKQLIDPEGYAKKHRDASALWVQANVVKRRLINARYARNHPEQVAAKMARRRARVASVVIVEEVDRQIVFERDKWICQICQKRVSKTVKFPHPLSASIDHIIPLSKGGEESYRNCVLVHFGCNARKQSRVVVQQMRLLP